MNNTKKVLFNEEKNEIYIIDYEYDRFSIESLAYLKARGLVTFEEWNKMLYELREYKYSEMVVHKLAFANSINTTSI